MDAYIEAYKDAYKEVNEDAYKKACKDAYKNACNEARTRMRMRTRAYGRAYFICISTETRQAFVLGSQAAQEVWQDGRKQQIRKGVGSSTVFVLYDFNNDGINKRLAQESLGSKAKKRG